MTSFVLGTIKSQLPMLVEKFEPALESAIRSSLQTMKAKHPEETAIFLANWTKLDAAVKSELAVPVKVGARRVKRTRKVHRKHRK